jgi:gamma-tubulin complex component 4
MFTYECRSDYFLLRNGEFALAFIREIEQLKLSRLTARVAPSSMIREQDLHLAILRASLGTSAQHDASLAHLRCTLPNGPMRPLLPSLSGEQIKHTKPSQASLLDDLTTFDDLVLGTPMVLTYAVKWPLDLFLVPSDLKIYGALFSYMMSLRKTHMRVHACWASLSNAQRARRKWTGLNDGGTETDLKARKELLRYGWGVVRQMGWLLDTLLEYLMNDVVDVEFKRLKESLSHKQDQGTRLSASQLKAGMQESTGPSYIDFTSLRIMHTGYLNRLLVGSLLANPEVSMIIREILQICERFVAQVERWGGDVLPALLFEGSLSSETPEKAGSLVRERWKITTEINSVRCVSCPFRTFSHDFFQSLQSLLHTFYEQLTASMSQQPVVAGADASRSVMHNITIADALTGFQTTIIAGKNGKGNDAEGDVRRHIERLLLRLDFNSAFSKPVPSAGEVLGEGANILKAGGLA